MSESEQRMGDDPTGGFAPIMLPEDAPQFVKDFFAFLNSVLRRTPDATALGLANELRNWMLRNYNKEPAT